MKTTTKPLFNRLCAMVSFGVASLAVWAAPEVSSNAIPAQATGHRFLILVENSRAMEKRGPGAAKALQDVIGSGFGGQVRRGDSLGVWTYNEQLYTGKFPLQLLAPGQLKGTAATVISFLTQQPFDKQGHFEKVMPTLGLVITNSQILTVLIVSTGSEDIHGTPFDEPINSTYRQWRSQQLTRHMPFVTLLRAYNGQIKQYSIAVSPFALEIPPLLEEAPAQNIVQTKVAAPAPKAATAPVPSLIVSGKKPERPMQTADASPRSQPSKVVVPAPPLAPTDSAVAAVQPSTLTLATPSSSAPTSRSAEVAAPRLTLADASQPARSTSTEPISAHKQTEIMAAAVPPVAQNVSPAAAERATLAPVNDAPKTEPSALVRQVAEVKAESRPATIPVPLAQPEAAGSSRSGLLQIALYVLVGFFLLGIIIMLVQRHQARERATRTISLITRSLDRQVP